MTKRATLLLALLSLLLCCSALAGALAIGPQRAAAADETEGTTTEEPPPVVETPTETEAPPEPEGPATETPVTTPPGEAPPVSEGGSAPVEAPKAPAPPRSETASGGGGGGSAGGGGGGPTGGSGSTGTTTTSPSATTIHRSGRVRAPSSNAGGGSKAGAGVDNGGGDAGGGGTRSPAPHAPSHSGGGRSSQPTVSPQAIDEGASAVSHAASHVGEVFAEALPTAPLKKIGDRVAAHIAGVSPGQSAEEQKQAVDRIGTALGAALIGSAVAVDRSPASSDSPIPFFDPPGGKSGTIYLILIAALLLAVGALVLREARSALGFNAPRTAVRVADEKPRIEAKVRVAAALAGVRHAGDRWSSRARRIRSNAVAGLRSLF